MELTVEDQALLAFECAWWTQDGPKSDRIRVDLGISSSTFYKRLAELIDTREAFEFDPLLILRLRRRNTDDGLGSPATGGPEH